MCWTCRSGMTQGDGAGGGASRLAHVVEGREGRKGVGGIELPDLVPDLRGHSQEGAAGLGVDGCAAEVDATEGNA